MLSILTFHLPIYLLIYVSIYLPTYLAIHLSIYLSIYLFLPMTIIVLTCFPTLKAIIKNHKVSAYFTALITLAGLNFS